MKQSSRWSLVTGCLLAVGLAAVAAQTTTPPQTPPAPPGQQQPLPVFRGGTNLVLVDAYPRLNGKVIEGLKPGDFEVMEDGKPQKIEQFEFVRVEPVPEAERRDPNTQAEMLQAAADPHNRVFVLFLDTYSVSMSGSQRIRSPLVDMLNRILAPNDLFGLTTQRVPASTLVLGRKLISVENQLASKWPWGEKDAMLRTSEEELLFDRCFGTRPDTGRPLYVDDDGVRRLLPNVLVDRWREDKVLTSLKELIVHLGKMREARTMVIALTGGWRLFPANPALSQMVLGSGAAPPQVGIPQGGGNLGIQRQGANGLPVEAACNAELSRLAALDDRRAFLDVIALANRNNVAFYPVSPDGLTTGDVNPAEVVMPSPNQIGADMSHSMDRIGAASSLADETGGIAIVRTNDLRAGLSRIIDDVSAYYLLGYYSTNDKPDGRLRQIKVKVNQPKATVSARKSYIVPTAAAAAATAAAKVAAAGPVVPTEIADALKSLAKANSDSEVIAAGGVSGANLVVVAEIAGSQIEVGKWTGGGAVHVTAIGANGQALPDATAQIDPGVRGAVVKMPIGTATGPWRVGVTITGKEGTIEDRININVSPASKILGDPVVYRGRPGARSVFRPVADMSFGRTETIRVEMLLSDTLDQRSARLLDRRGQPVPLGPTMTERVDADQSFLDADLTLAPLAPGDYVLEITAGHGSAVERRFVAIRIGR